MVSSNWPNANLDPDLIFEIRLGGRKVGDRGKKLGDGRHGAELHLIRRAVRKVVIWHEQNEWLLGISNRLIVVAILKTLSATIGFWGFQDG